jgi:hypothetical protein
MSSKIKRVIQIHFRRRKKPREPDPFPRDFRCFAFVAGSERKLEEYD